MKYFCICLGILLGLVFTAHNVYASEDSTVIRIISADTIIVDKGEPVHLLGVLAPGENDYYYQESKDYLSSLLLGQEVELVADNKNSLNGNRDEFGRRLAYVYRIKDKKFINVVLIQQGYCFYSSKNVGKNATSFLLEQSAARKANKGLWTKASKSPEEIATEGHITYSEPAFELKEADAAPDLRVEILWAKKADPRARVGRSAEEAKFLTRLYKEEKVGKGEVPALEQLRRNLAEALTAFYQEQKVALRIETSGDTADVLKFSADGMDQADADKFCAERFNKDLFAGLEFKEVIFTDNINFNYSYKVPSH